MQAKKTCYVLPYNKFSKSAEALANALECKRIRVEGSNYQPNHEKLVVNWGNATQAARKYAENGAILNTPTAINICADKKKFFKRMDKEIIPEWTVDFEEAQKWVVEGATVLGRYTLRGKGGEGIYFSDSDDRFEQEYYQNSKMWVKYIPKMREYRVHVFKGEVIDIQQKKLRKEDDAGNKVDPKEINWRVRNHKNGFIFARQDLEIPECVPQVALKAFEGLPLDFGAFDVIWNKAQDRAWVLECNTAPGLEGQTLEKYKEAILKHG